MGAFFASTIDRPRDRARASRRVSLARIRPIREADVNADAGQLSDLTIPATVAAASSSQPIRLELESAEEISRAALGASAWIGRCWPMLADAG